MLKTKFLNLEFENPLVLASGIRGISSASLELMTRAGCGGVTLKSISLEPRTGHPNPTLAYTDHFVINAIGLSNPGIDEIKNEIELFKKSSNVPLITSIFAGTVDEFVRLAEKINETKADILEINLSCPNVSSEFNEPFAISAKMVATITKKIKEKTSIPIAVKLSPHAWNIAEIAKAAEDSGADAITAINTMSGMIIDTKSSKPFLHNKVGGISGPALFPIALKAVFDIHKAVKTPIIGTGGITTGEDAIAMIIAGATLLGIGSAVHYRGVSAFKKISKEIEDFMLQQNIKSLDEIRGAANTS